MRTLRVREGDQGVRQPSSHRTTVAAGSGRGAVNAPRGPELNEGVLGALDLGLEVVRRQLEGLRGGEDGGDAHSDVLGHC